VFIKDEAEIASRVGGAERAVLYLGYSCCLSPMRTNSVLGVESKYFAHFFITITVTNLRVGNF